MDERPPVDGVAVAADGRVGLMQFRREGREVHRHRDEEKKHKGKIGYLGMQITLLFGCSLSFSLSTISPSLSHPISHLFPPPPLTMPVLGVNRDDLHALLGRTFSTRVRCSALLATPPQRLTRPLPSSLFSLLSSLFSLLCSAARV